MYSTSTVYHNLVTTLQGELLYMFCSVTYIIALGKLLGCRESELQNQLQ